MCNESNQRRLESIRAIRDLEAEKKTLLRQLDSAVVDVNRIQKNMEEIMHSKIVVEQQVTSKDSEVLKLQFEVKKLQQEVAGKHEVFVASSSLFCSCSPHAPRSCWKPPKN